MKQEDLIALKGVIAVQRDRTHKVLSSLTNPQLKGSFDATKINASAEIVPLSLKMKLKEKFKDGFTAFAE